MANPLLFLRGSEGYSIAMAGRLQGKVALVPGASRGIGRATALLFAQQGASVVVNYWKSSQKASEVVGEIQKADGRAIAIQADVSIQNEVTSMVERTISQFKRVDILVNNAAVFHRGSLFSLDDGDLDQMLAINVRGVIYCSQAVAKLMMEQRYGKIINLSSIAALGTAFHGTTPYALTKAAVISLTKRLALELGPYGVNVNAICPGLIRTDMVTSDGTPQEAEQRLEAVGQKAMLGRYGNPEDVAYAALFLATDESSFITGQLLTVDGGRMDFLSYSG